MNWNERYGADSQPTPEAVDAFIGNPLWAAMNQYMQSAYQTQPRMAYSGCSGQPGWNLKYQKSGKSLGTLYPMPGFFIALVVIGAKEATGAELLLPVLSDYTQDLYRRTPFSAGGQWLMINVTDEAILQDVERLVALRVKPKA